MTEEGISLAHFEGAFMFAASLQGVHAPADEAHFERADLRYANLEGRHLFEAHFEDADLRGAYFSDVCFLNGAWLGSETDGVARLADIKWRGTNVAQVRWVTPARWARGRAADAGELGSPLVQIQRRLRASHQLALVLRSQGLTGEADSFAYKAQVLQRRVHRLQRRPLRYLGSWLLDLISGYGYRPLRSFITYVVVILAFAATYFALGSASGQSLSWNEAIVVSMTAFHGRGFFAAVFQPGDLQAAVAAAEAFVGLLIEIVFIATFTQRFFAR